MKRVLITGMSGAGKTSLLDELAARGYQAVDTDYGDYFQAIDGETAGRAIGVSPAAYTSVTSSTSLSASTRPKSSSKSRVRV